MPDDEYDGPLFCEGCDGELDSDGACPSPSCDVNGAEYYSDTSAEPELGPTPAAVGAAVIRAGDDLEHAPEWLRTAVRDALQDFPPVHLALARAALEVRGVPKDRQSPADQGGYKFRGIDGILSAVHHPLAEAGILMVPRDLEVEREPWPHWGQGKWTLYRVHLEWKIFGPRGDTLVTDNWGEALDNGDKGLGKARSYAQKDLLIRLLTIPTDDPDMGDTEASSYPTDDDEGAPAQRRQRRSRGDASGEAEAPGDPADILEVQLIIAGLDEQRRGEVREAWKRSIGKVAPEDLTARQARTAKALVRGMVPDHAKLREQAAMRATLGLLALAGAGGDVGSSSSPGQDDGSGDDASPGPTVEGDASSSAGEGEHVAPAGEDASSPAEDDDSRAEAKAAERRQRAATAAALRDRLGAIEPSLLDQHGTEVGELHWQAVDKDLRDTYGVGATPELHIDIRRMALVIGRAAGPEVLAELVAEGVLPGVADED